MAEDKAIPSKVRPLRDPGQSLRHQLRDLEYDEVLPWMAMICVAILWSAWEWARLLLPVPMSPWMVTVASVILILLGVRRITTAANRAKNIHQGLEGERFVGQCLESLRSSGYKVFHDIAEDGFNIDHVLVGPTGVYAIETKTISKPVGREAEVVYDAQRILVDGRTPDRDPLKQACANADRIRDILRERTGQKAFVRPVVLYPGWYIRKKCRSPQVWVVNEQYLAAWLDHESESLSSRDVEVYSAALASYVRAKS